MAAPASAPAASATQTVFVRHAPGLEVGLFPASTRAPTGDSLIRVVRVDPRYFEFRLLSARALGLERNPTAPQWVARYGLTGAINASMYRRDHRTSVFYMRDRGHVNNGVWSKKAGAVFATDPRGQVPEVQILDRECDDLDRLAPRYGTLVQNYRMLDCARRGTWARSSQVFSIAAVGTDGAGRVLLIHCRSAYTVHDVTESLLALPLDLRRLMYVEGGPEASLEVRANGRTIVSEVGSFETGFQEDDKNRAFWPLPNVIGFTPRPAPPPRPTKVPPRSQRPDSNR